MEFLFLRFQCAKKSSLVIGKLISARFILDDSAQWIQSIAVQQTFALCQVKTVAEPYTGHLDQQAGGGAMKIIACIEDPSVIRKILDPLDRRAPITAPHSLPEPRAPPPAGLFDTP